MQVSFSNRRGASVDFEVTTDKGVKFRGAVSRRLNRLSIELNRATKAGARVVSESVWQGVRESVANEYAAQFAKDKTATASGEPSEFNLVLSETPVVDKRFDSLAVEIMSFDSDFRTDCARLLADGNKAELIRTLGRIAAGSYNGAAMRRARQLLDRMVEAAGE